MAKSLYPSAMTQHQNTPNSPSDDDHTPPPAMGGADLGLNFIISILLCAGAGYGLDKWLGTLPLFMLIGCVLGFAAGLYVIWIKIKKT